jgi:hypothetical protein
MYLGCIISFFVVLYILMIYIVSNLCEPIIPQIKHIKIPKIITYSSPFTDKSDVTSDTNDVELKNAVDQAFDLVF